MTLEILLNKLIELGWKPRNKEFLGIHNSFNYTLNISGDKIIIGGTDRMTMFEYFSLNDLCSIDSGLRQFVVENELYVKEYRNSYIERKFISPTNEEIFNWGFNYMSEKFRTCQSSIVKDKEKFLLDNIKIDEVVK